MKTLKIMAGAMLLAGVATPAVAQDGAMELTTQQQTMYDGWTAEQQTTYDAWPMAAQTYYWTLDDMQKDVWWNALNNEQRVRIVGMNAQQRTAAWQSIRNQVNDATTSAAATSTTSSSATTRSSSANASGNMRFVQNAVVQDAPAPHNGEYPPCRGDLTDNCINPREAGLDYGNRPLDYWPGQPASQMD